MSYFKNNAAWVLGLCLALGSSACLIGRPMCNKDAVSVRDYYEDWWQRFNVHSSPQHRLVFRGLVFEDVRGSAPFYLKLPSINAIMFVQGAKGGHGQKIVVLYANGQKVIFEDRYSGFMETLGEKELAVVSSSDRMIELKSHSGLVDVTYWFDLSTRQFSKKY